MNLEIPKKAVSIWNPHAWFAGSGQKEWETRSWRAWHRGPIAIHAAKKVVAGPRLDPAWGLIEPGEYTFGAIIGVAFLARVERTEALADLSPWERALGDFRPGRWAWRLENAAILPEPVKVSGRQGIFSLPREVRDAIAESLAGVTS